jgi:hypothetical protein
MQQTPAAQASAGQFVSNVDAGDEDDRYSQQQS